jgi:hypothetical protein
MTRNHAHWQRQRHASGESPDHDHPRIQQQGDCQQHKAVDDAHDDCLHGRYSEETTFVSKSRRAAPAMEPIKPLSRHDNIKGLHPPAIRNRPAGPNAILTIISTTGAALTSD